MTMCTSVVTLSPMTDSNTQTITILPGYREWMGSPQWREHLLDERHIYTDVPGCLACEQGPLMQLIHDRVFSGHAHFANIAWSLQDGYGVIGGEPGQHFDWSGIRDSSPAQVSAIFRALTADDKCSDCGAPIKYFTRIDTNELVAEHADKSGTYLHTAVRA